VYLLLEGKRGRDLIWTPKVGKVWMMGGFLGGVTVTWERLVVGNASTLGR